jgi:NADH-quinone oxidoreductase subunit G
MSDDQVNIEVNGVPMKARKGQMVIHVTDAHEVYVPRFCYHDKLPIAANCRMCLVEVEKAPKPLPACATPVAEGMKVFTKSPKAIAAQKAVMEFLLINHPLDCPICDQGGECELQDLAMGFGRDVSRYAERKRVVKDKNLGPLVSTDMTRCIHCTRCVRFSQVIQGFQELGTVGRGEFTEISTYIEKSVDHELSANIIDLCPVGALNNKPYRYRARAWEMTQHPLVSPHDSVGTNVYAHVLRGRVMRIVPRTNEAINETWIADRDRYSYDGIYSADRLRRPMMKEGGAWREVDWETALAAAAERLQRVVKQHGAAQLGALANPSSTLEELHLLARLTRGVGSHNLDHRLRQQDFSDQANDPVVPWLGCTLAELEQMESILVIGSNLRKDVPMLAHRVRKAAMGMGPTTKAAKVGFVNPVVYDYLFPVSAYFASNGLGVADHLAALLAAATEGKSTDLPSAMRGAVAGARPTDSHRAFATQLASGERRVILLGAIAQRDPGFAEIRRLAAALAAATGAHLGYIPEGGNAVGAHLAGVLPHRATGGKVASTAGLSVGEMLAARLKTFVVLGAVEPQFDVGMQDALEALKAAECVIALTPYATAQEYAHIILPIGTFAETSGTYVNLEGSWQSVPGCATPVGESRPGWKVLRVLGNLLNLPGFDYVSSEQVRDELRAAVGTITLDNQLNLDAPISGNARGTATRRNVDVPIYQVDAVVRRSQPLQQTPEARLAHTGATS